MPFDDEKFNKLCGQIDLIDERTGRLVADVDKLMKIVALGDDGGEPLLAKTARLEEKVDSVEKATASKWSFRASLVVSILAVAGIAIQSCV